MRYLTKSRFKLAIECPTKLFYTRKKEYADQSLDDPFLLALAEGGFQVGELAKAYHPDGVDVTSLGVEESLRETNRLLRQENATIFEAAVRHKNLFIRIDVLRKRGNVFDLVEVKSKSFDSADEFVAKRDGKASAKWRPYLLDVAFQEHVLRNAFPQAIVRPFLMLANKNARTSVDGLNQRFKLVKTKDLRTVARPVGDVSLEGLGEKILLEANLRDYMHIIQAETFEADGRCFDFAGYIDFLAAKYEADEKIPPVVSCATCKRCTFKTTARDEANGLKSGFKECWRESQGLLDADFETPNIMDVWNFRNQQKCLEAGRFLLRDLSESDLDSGDAKRARQWIQICKTVAGDPTPWVDVEALREAFATWRWPLHFIDFETSVAAIPFCRGRSPYEVVAFQFSHHIAHEDGRIEHADDYLDTRPGGFPNFDFVRRLKASLDTDKGTIFRYAAHENTVLNHIANQLRSAPDVADRDELINWITTVTCEKTPGMSERTGKRNMVDLLELVKKCYFQLDMGGSNSIKYVLPAVLNSSGYLRGKYARPIYNGLNFTNQRWVEEDANGRVKDPYKLLPPIFAGIPQEELEAAEANGRLADGGAAMTAYARLQFSDVSKTERACTCKALLRYCELDTLAMVMIWEAWAAILKETP